MDKYAIQKSSLFNQEHNLYNTKTKYVYLNYLKKNLVPIGNKSTMATMNQMCKRILRFSDLVPVKNTMYLFVYSSYFFCIWNKSYQLLIITKKDKKQAVYIQSKLLISI